MNESREKKVIVSVAIIAAIFLGAAWLMQDTDTVRQTQDLQRVGSLDELSNLLQAQEESNSYAMRSASGGSSTGEVSVATAAPQAADASSDNSLKADTQDSGEYSSTNVQVQGVDEPDFVKTDGTYLYIASNNNVTIVEAYPATNARILSTIPIDGYYNQLFINDDQLVVYGQEAYNYATPYAIDSMIRAPYPYEQPRSFIRVYDISDRTSPEMVKEITYQGNYHDARMVGSHVYTIADQPLIRSNDDITLPSVSEDGQDRKIAATSIYYFPEVYGYQLSTVFALDLDSLELTKDSFLTGYTQTLYMSEHALYLTAPKQVDYQDYQQRMLEEVVIASLEGDARSEALDILESDRELYVKENALQELMAETYNELSINEKADFEARLRENMQAFQDQWEKETQKTVIHKIELDRLDIQYTAKGEVPGYLLNQFSLDENDGYLRVATTTNQQYWGGPILFAQASGSGAAVAREGSVVMNEKIAVDPIMPTPSMENADKNHVYVLDADLDMVGKLENLAPGERIYSARFMGDRVYLVTFRQVDPLFVISLENPRNPEVLGQLKIPGFSTYLHPFDETHIIGIGQDTQGDVQEGSIMAAIPAGLKLALFDVSDPEHPQEVDRYIIGARGSESSALYDHKAFLFDANKELLVIPTTVREAPRSQEPWAWGKVVFQGAYVFRLTKEDGFMLQGTVTHMNASEQSAMAAAKEQEYYYPAYEATIQRSLYIDNTLYTVSQREVQAHDLATLQQEARVALPMTPPQIYYAEDAISFRAA